MNITSILRQRCNFLVLVCCCGPLLLAAQEDSAKEKRESLIYIKYYVIDNRVPYLNIQTKNKIDKAFVNQDKVPVQIYLDNDSSAESLVGRVVTNEKGVATIGLPANLAAKWGEKSSHTFYVRTDSSANFGATTEELLVYKSKLELDTVNEDGTRKLKARLLKNESGTMVPIAGADVRLAVKRLGGFLKIGEEETYTTDSTGKVEGEFTIKDLPGDSLGNIELVALVDDNEVVGSLDTRLKAPWGVPAKFVNNFDNERSLSATGNKAPGSLLIIALGCIIGVWSVIISLIGRIIKIRKLGALEK